MTFYPYSPIIIDLSFKEYLQLFSRFFTSNDRAEIQKSLEDAFLKDQERENLIPTLSVRTGFDLFLQAADFSKGSEIIMTGINIPDMPAIVENHGLIPVPVDLDMATLAPKIEDIEKCITPNTRAILVSYIFGAIFNLDEIVKLAKKHGLYVIEDLAEAFMGQDYNGHPEADLSLFSFGAIKYNTSLNGGLVVVRNNDVLYRKMIYLLERYPMQKVSTYFKKCVKLIVPALVMNTKLVNKAFRKIGRMISENFEEWGISLLRGFPQNGGDYLSKFRFQVSTPLLANLAARMIAFNKKHFEEDIHKIKVGLNMLLEAGVEVPGHKADPRSFWLFPIVVSDVQGCKKLLNDRGVNAYVGATQLKIVESPSGSKFASPEETRKYFDKMVYLPIQKNVPESVIVEMCKVTIQTINDVENRQMPY